ncbi:MAG: DUF3068 domain-containing protein [Acidobacteria bacterium]|nr:DUF3068 domain-containing protein [Acidobacteriota bacterium]
MSLTIRRLLFCTGIALIAAAGAWRFLLAPRWTQRIPPGWKWETTFIGAVGYADPASGVYPVKNPTSTYQRSVRAASELGRPASVRMQDRMTTLNPRTGKKEWEYISEALVNPASGAHADPRYRGDYYLFPRHVSKRAYRLRQNYLKGTPLAFEAEEEIAGLNTYVFSYRGAAEYTESFAGTADYPGVRVAPGQEIRCADHQFRFRIWVEPVTGETLKIEESCWSGDTVYDARTQRPVQPIVRWGGVVAGDAVTALAERARAARARILAAEYLPGVLVLLGLTCAGLPLVRRKPRKVPA